MTKSRVEPAGRSSEIARFAECAERAFQGTPVLLLFEGEPGSGKTTLLDWINASPQLSGRRTRVIRIDPETDSGLDPIRRAADMLTHAKAYAHVGGRRRFRTLAAKLLPDWLGALPVIGNFLEAATVTVQAVRKRTRRDEKTKFTEDISELHRYARKRSLALLLDNAQALDEHTADRLCRLVEAAPEQTRLLVVCMTRTPPPGAPKPALLALRHHVSEKRLVYDHLQALSLGEIHEWLNARFREKPLPPAVINFLLVETGGQPGLVLKVIDELIQRGMLHETDTGWSHEALTDADVVATEEAATYLGSLRSDVADIVRSASLFGDEFDALTLAQLLQIDELDLEDRLAVAVRFGLLTVAGEWTQPSGDISTLYRFSSTAARAALSRSLSGEQRDQLAARMAGL